MPPAALLDRAADELGGFLPRLAGALVLIVAGLLVARVLGALTRRVLVKAGVDELAGRLGVTPVLERAKLGDSISHLVGRAVRLGLTLVVIFAALSLLGLQFLSDSLNSAVLFLPNLAIAALLILSGLVLGGFIRERVERIGREMDLPIPLGAVAQGTVVAIFALTAAAQVAISTAILLALVAVVLSGVVAMLALSLGIGSSRVSRELTAGRYLRSSFQPGQRISFADHGGTVVAVEATSTMLRDDAGRMTRVPNDLLLGSVVVIEKDSSTA